jgi:regulator of protease activity HflC (stomatin/prohibitin superfamily)
MTSSYIVLGVAALIVLWALITVSRAVRVVQQGLLGVVKRLGQYHSVRDPGLTFLVPFIDKVEMIDMRETPRTGDRQDVITKDNVSVVVNATIFSQVIDARLALFTISSYLLAVDQLSRTNLRSVFGELTLDECLSQREKINARLQESMEATTDKWGVRINRVEIVDIVPPQNVLNAMALQKQAEQEKRAAVLQSEGQQLSQINVAEGQKQAQIKQAEGQKQAAILYAEGQMQAQVLEAEGRSQAIANVYGAIKAGAPTPELLAVLQLETLSKFATSASAKLLVPYEAVGLMGAAQALRSALDNVPEAVKGNNTTPTPVRQR